MPTPAATTHTPRKLREIVSIELTDTARILQDSQLYGLMGYTQANTTPPETPQAYLNTYRDQTLFTLRSRKGWLDFWSSRASIMAVQQVEQGELFMVVLGRKEQWKTDPTTEESSWTVGPDHLVRYHPSTAGLVQLVVPIAQRDVFLQTISSAKSLYSQKARLFFRNKEAGVPPRELVACLSSGSTKRSMARLMSTVALPMMSHYAREGLSNRRDSPLPASAPSSPVKKTSRLSPVQSIMGTLSASTIATGAVSDIVAGLESTLTRMRSCGTHADQHESTRNARGLFRRKVPLSSDPAHFVIKLPGRQNLRLQRDKGEWVLYRDNGATEMARWPTLVRWQVGQTYIVGPVAVEVVALKRKSLPFPTGKHSSKRLLMPIPGSEEYRLVARDNMTEAELLLWGFIVYTIRVSESIPLGWLTVLWMLVGTLKGAQAIREIGKA
jgi:hypothetical protein